MSCFLHSLFDKADGLPKLMFMRCFSGTISFGISIDQKFPWVYSLYAGFRVFNTFPVLRISNECLSKEQLLLLKFFRYTEKRDWQYLQISQISKSGKSPIWKNFQVVFCKISAKMKVPRKFVINNDHLTLNGSDWVFLFLELSNL